MAANWPDTMADTVIAKSVCAKQVAECLDIVDCIRMTWSVPAAVPQMMMLMKHTVISSLLLYWRLSTWIS